MAPIDTYSDLEEFLRAESIEDVWARLLDCLQECGFQNVLYGYTRFHTDHGYGSSEDNLVLTNLGDTYVQKYFRDGLYKDGPIVQWASENDGVCPWSYVDEIYETLPEKSKEVVRFNRDFGMTHGYTIGLHSHSKRQKGAIGMSLTPFDSTQEEADEIWKEYGRDVTIVCGVAHLKIISLPFETRRLTKRQREALEWVGDGKTNAEVATIMSLTPATVEKHLKLARDTLGVDSTAQAVLKASLHNQIYIT